MRRIATIVGLTILTLSGALAQTGGSNFPLPLGPTNAGKEFWFSFPSNWEVAGASPKYVRLYITSNVRTNVNVVADGGGFLTTVQTTPFDFVTVDLPTSTAQVVVRNDQSPVPPDQVYTKKAIHITADEPVVVYGLNRIQYTTDGMLILPTNALGQDYVVASAADIADGGIQKLPSQYVVVAPYDSTTVTIVNPMDSPNHKADSTFTISMNKGDVFSSMSTGAGGDLSGALIRADRPVAVMAGQNCTYLPNFNYPACDHIEEMLLPISAWGTHYHSVPYAERLKGDLYRIFAGEDNAKIYVNGVHLGTLPKVGGGQGIGWLEFLPPQRGLIDISSDKPISVAQYNNSGQYDNVKSDPFYVMLTPVDQYMDEMVFTTPAKDYPKNYINIVCDSAGFYDIEIAEGATGAWEKLATKFPSVAQSFPTTYNGKRYAGKTIEIQPGSYRMRGKSEFAAYIYGNSAYDSYGYPLAAKVVDLFKAKEDANPPGITAQTVDTNGTWVGTVTDLPADPARRSNVSTVDIDQTQSTNYALTMDPFIPGMTSSLTYRLTVRDRTKDAHAVVVTYDMAGNRSYDTVSYTAPLSTSAVGAHEVVRSASGLELSSTNPVSGGMLDAGYVLPKGGTVTLALFDAAGAAVATLVDGRTIPAGRHAASVSVEGLSSGLYFLRLSVDDVVLTSQVVISR